MTGWSTYESAPSNRLPWLLLAIFLGVCIWGVWHCTAKAEEVLYGTATWYSQSSAKSEGTSGTYTASGEVYDESAFTLALRRRDFGGIYRVCRVDPKRPGIPVICQVARQNDYGPGRAATKRGVVADLSPALFDALGGQRGCTQRGVWWGEIAVTVEEIAPLW